MKPLFPRPVLMAACLATAAAQETEIHCTDGSRIRGSVQAIGTDRVLFNADFLAAPVPLRLDKVLELSLPVHQDEGKGDHLATVTLSNGDTLRGELTGIDDKTITLDTWFGGKMEFRRSMVDTLEIQDRPEIFYSGPTGMDGWIQSDAEAWIFEHGSLRTVSSGSIGRELELPARTRFAFDLAWRSNPRFHFLFYSDDATTEHPENCYELICQGRYIQLHKRWSNGNQSGNTSLGGFANASELLSKEKCRFELLVDRKTGLIRLLINGSVKYDWNDPEPAAGDHGGAIHFDSQDTTPLRVSRIEVTSWDGMIEGSAPDREEGMIEDDDAPQPDNTPPADPTRIRLRNNDMVAGEIVGIDDNLVKLKTPFGEVSLPVSRLRTFTLHTKEERENWELGLYEIPKLYNGDVRAWFPDGTSVTFRLESVEDGKLKGTAQPFGNAEFDIRAFCRIEFNLYDPDFDELRSGFDRW
ncbi:hypothetical protein [Luteolibacter marinus]|uniref:hypothetical protein n=1 Tax=Luteolibacter marinus TaxID=2776705 RepID=UPI0018660023|nr:hypothetical protein [Luteolibacter marinus]